MPQDPNFWNPAGTSALVREALTLMSGTSITSRAIVSSGNVAFLTQEFLYFDVGMWLLVVDHNDSDNFMVGQVVSYDATTGDLVIEVAAKSGSGTIDDWDIYITGAYIPAAWNGGTVTDPVTLEATLDVEGATTLDTLVVGDASTFNAPSAFNAPITSNSGDVNLVTNETLADANIALTAAQTYFRNLLIEPTVNRTITLPTATDILAMLTGEVVGSHFDFTIVNKSNFSLTLLGNSGIVLEGITEFTEGSATYEVVVTSASIVTVVNISSPVSTEGVSDIATGSEVSSSSDIVIDSSSARLQSITMTAEGKSIILPPGTSLPISSPRFVIHNAGYYPIGIKDNTGKLLRAIDAGGSATISLVSNTTIAGLWMITGQNLKGGVLTAKGVLASTYGVDVLFNQQLLLTDDLSVHFAKIASNGLAVFIVDHANQAIGTPVSISTTANTRPAGIFKITDSTFMLFYNSSGAVTTMHAVVISVSGTVPTLGSVATYTVASSNVGIGDGIGAPKLAQLDTNLFALIYASTSAGTNAVVGCQVSGGTTVTWGSPQNLVGNTGSPNSGVIFKLTTTTALLLYKINAATPFQGKAVVVSITNANPPVCTLGTAVNTLGSRTVLTAPACNMISATVCALVDNNDDSVSQATLILIQVTGTTITVNTPVILDTSAGFGGNEFSAYNASRFCPHIVRLSDSSFLWWGATNSDVFKVLVAEVAFPVLTVGTKLTESGGWHCYPIAFSSTHFLTVTVGLNVNKQAAIMQPYKISGNTLSVGKPLRLDSVVSNSIEPFEYTGVYLGNNTYGVISMEDTTVQEYSSSLDLSILMTDGVHLKDMGGVDLYPAAFRGDRNLGGVGVSNFLAALDDRLVVIESTQGDIDAVTEQVRVNLITTIA